MNKEIQTLLANGTATTSEALAICDALDPVDTDFMLGAWQGSGFDTGHPMDGLLEAFHWHGKCFESPEHVHPLVFRTLRGGVTCVNPTLMAPGLALSLRVHLPRHPVAGRLFQLALPLFSTSRSKARLRMTGYRGKISATMIYDKLPINDVFRRIDDNSVFGIMDYKGMEQPFFFRLDREFQPSDRRR